MIRPITTFNKQDDITAQRLNDLVDEICHMVSSNNNALADIERTIYGMTHTTTPVTTLPSGFFRGVTNPNIVGVMLQNEDGDTAYIWPNKARNGVITRTSIP